MVFGLFLFGLSAFGDTPHPANSRIQDSVGVLVSEAGLANLSDSASVLVPSDPIPMDSISQSGGTWCFNYEFALSDAAVVVDIQDLTLRPTAGEFQVDLSMLVSINDSSDKFDLAYELLCVGEDCPGYVSPFLVEAAVPIGIQVATHSDGHRVFDAVLGTPLVNHYLESDDIELDCNIGTVEEVLDYFGLSLFDVIIGAAEDAIQDAILDAVGDLEAQLDEALAQAYVNETFEIQGSEIQLELQAQEANIDASGMELILEGVSSADRNACISGYDTQGGSQATITARPQIGDLSSSSGMAAIIADDFINQLLYAAWRGGVLCYRLDESSDLGIPINTSLLGLVGGEAFDELFPEPNDLVILTDPKLPPEVAMGGEHDLSLQANALGVNFYADLDYRMARALGVEIVADVGADLVFDGATGDLAVELDLEGDAIQISAEANELAPESNEAVVEGMSSLLTTAMDTLLGDTLDGLVFQLGSINGVGLRNLGIEAAGTEQDWLSASVDVGPVPYGSGGCDDDGGCGGGETGGCDEGCSTGRAGLWPLWLIVLPLGLLLRRRSVIQ